jgi:hypothetical protein
MTTTSKKKKRGATPALNALARDYIETVFGYTYSKDIRVIPEGERGGYQVKDSVDAKEEVLYQELLKDGELIADNHPGHVDRHRHFLKAAQGHVLISGLWLGDSLHQVLQNPEVKSVTVIEKSQEIIELVAPAFKDDGRVEFLNEDIFEVEVDAGDFDVIYHAIWNRKEDITQEVKEMLDDRFADRCDWHGFVFSPGRGGTRKGAGRKKGVPIGPTKSSSEKREHRTAVRFTEHEYQLIAKACEVSGLTESAVIQRGAVIAAKMILKDSAVLKDPELKSILTS